MRSKLFVPGVRPELFAKALAGDADALSFDLEDSVPEDRKADARAQVSALVQSLPLLASAKLIVITPSACPVRIGLTDGVVPASDCGDSSSARNLKVKPC